MLPRILAMLPPAEAEWLMAALRPDAPFPRYAERDSAVCRALALYDLAPTAAAKALGIAYDHYLITAWRGDREMGGPSCDATAHRRALFDLALANDERSLGWRRIYDIAFPG